MGSCFLREKQAQTALGLPASCIAQAGSSGLGSTVSGGLFREEAQSSWEVPGTQYWLPRHTGASDLLPWS